MHAESDKQIGFDQIVKNYYLPGWHQPAAINELIINKAKWDSMTEGQQGLIELTCRETMLWGLTSTYVENAQAIDAFKANGVEIRQFPEEVLAGFKTATDDVMQEQSAKDESFARAWNSLQAYRDSAASWAAVQ